MNEIVKKLDIALQGLNKVLLNDDADIDDYHVAVCDAVGYVAEVLTILEQGEVNV
jgi:hypothetical protein